MQISDMPNDSDFKKNPMYKESLNYHIGGKVGLDLPKPPKNQNDLSIAYSPWVAAPCLEIEKKPELDFEYTSRSRTVAVISNGTAVLGLGNIGSRASKPVMEGKAVLFKYFAGLDAVDVEVDTEDIDEFVNTVKNIGNSWGGINLEDIKAPECFIIEEKLKVLLDIPVFHDDQHGTAVVTAAGIINALDLTNRKIEDVKIVVSGAGAAAIACTNLLVKMGAKKSNITMCDSRGVIYKGRSEGMNQWKEDYAIETSNRTLADAMKGADIFLGVSVKGLLTKAMVKSMSNQPIIFAMANPDPEITPEDAKSVRPDAIIATGRSDYSNQVNNVMAFPYIFRGALDVQASEINDEMKIAAVHAISKLARESVPEEVSEAYAGKRFTYGPDYIIPVPFDPRLIQEVSLAVANAAVKTKVARKPISNIQNFRQELAKRTNPTFNIMNLTFENLRNNPQRVVFADGEEEQAIRAAFEWSQRGYGEPILIGYEEKIQKRMKDLNIKDPNIKIFNASLSNNLELYHEQLYQRLQRKGSSMRDCIRMVNHDRNVFSSLMLNNNEADLMVSGLNKPYLTSLEDIQKVIDPSPNNIIFGMSIMLAKDRTIFFADTTIHELPTAQELVQIAIDAAAEARRLGHEPRVAFISFSNFGNPYREKARRIREAVALMDEMKVDFEYDGEMSPNVALNEERLKLYPFCRLTKPANILIMPALHSAHAASKLLQELGGGVLVGPILCGMSKPVQLVPIGSTTSEMLNIAALGATQHHEHKRKNVA